MSYKVSQTDSYYKVEQTDSYYKVVEGITEDIVAPVFQSAVIPANGLTITLTYNETLKTVNPATGDFSISGTSSVPDSVVISGATVIITLDAAIIQGETVLLSYTAGANPIQDPSGNEAANLTNQSVTNNSTFIAIALQSLIVPSSGLTLTMTYNKSLNESSVPATGDFSLSGTSSVVNSVDVDGVTVVLTMDTAILPGQTVTLDYTAGTNPIQDSVGNEAANLVDESVTNNSEAASYPAVLNDGNTVAWYDYLENVTKDGSNLVSVWGDKSGSNHDLLQVLGSNQPLATADGILFDGVDNYMKTGAFTLAQPTFLYLVLNQVNWVNLRRLIDGESQTTGIIQGATPFPGIIAGTAGNTSSINVNLGQGVFKIIRCLFNGASSKLIINKTTPTTYNAGTASMGGFTLGSQSSGAAGFANIEVKEIIIRKVADSVGDETDIYNYLANKYSL